LGHIITPEKDIKKGNEKEKEAGRQTEKERDLKRERDTHRDRGRERGGREKDVRCTSIVDEDVNLVFCFEKLLSALPDRLQRSQVQLFNNNGGSGLFPIIRKTVKG
jgi:hypothetical protein